MSDTITITVNDRVTGKCPKCRHADISIIKDREVRNGAGLCVELAFTIYCKHGRVCKHLVEGSDNG